ncbi:MAG: hypothetical protein C6Y22_25610 [Hapalosiphonaceae cyanobacterium JJU2]|nr:MAG: hypothetical protein C6Y22_25610 [Hapalosiphonaceae cyanobacterium JJU2]
MKEKSNNLNDETAVLAIKNVLKVTFQDIFDRQKIQEQGHEKFDRANLKSSSSAPKEWSESI